MNRSPPGNEPSRSPPSQSSPCTSSTTTSSSRTRARAPATTWRAASCRSRLLVAAGVSYGRVRAGARAAIALLAGFFGILASTEAIHYTRAVGPSGDDYTGLLSAVAGLALIGVGAVTLWRSRKTHDRIWWRYPRRLLLVGGAGLVTIVFLIPISVSYVVTHAARGHVPAADLGTPHEEVEFTTSDGLTLKGWYIRSRNGAAVISFPGRAASQERAKLLARHGYGVLLFDRRGEGESDGDPNLFGWQGERDVHAAVEVPAGPARRRPRADRRDRALRRRRDADRGGRRVQRAQGDRLRGRQRPLGPRHRRESRNQVAGGDRQQRRDRRDRGVHGQCAAGRA